MNFIPGKLYTHKNMLDTAVYVTKVSYRGTDYWELKISWFLKNGMAMNISERIKIKKSEFSNWYELNL